MSRARRLGKYRYAVARETAAASAASSTLGVWLAAGRRAASIRAARVRVFLCWSASLFI